MAKTLFDTLYAAVDEVKKVLSKPTKRGELVRQFQGHYDALAEKASKQANTIIEEYKKIGSDASLNLNNIVKARVEIQSAIDNQAIVAQEYRNTFSEDIKGVTVKELMDQVFNADGSIKVELEGK